MTGLTTRISPQRYARTCGFLYLYIIVAGIFAELFVRSRLVSTDAAATADNIMANESMFRIGASGELLHQASAVSFPRCNDESSPSSRHRIDHSPMGCIAAGHGPRN